MMHTILQQKNPIVPYLCAFVGTMFIIGEFVKLKKIILSFMSQMLMNEYI